MKKAERAAMEKRAMAQSVHSIATIGSYNLAQLLVAFGAREVDRERRQAWRERIDREVFNLRRVNGRRR